MIRYAKVNPETSPGSPIKIERHGRVLKNGQIELVEDGKSNLQDFYNSFAESCDIAVIIKRFLNGDANALQRRNPVFADFTRMPKTYADWLQMRLDGERKFDELSADVRAKFHNDVNEFLATAGDLDWLSAMGFSTDSLTLEKEVNVNAAPES